MCGCSGMPEGAVVGSIDGMESDILIVRQIPLNKSSIRYDTIAPYSGEKVVFVKSITEPTEVTLISSSLSKFDIDRPSFIAIPGDRLVVEGEIIDGISVVSVKGSSVFGSDYAKVESEAVPLKKEYNSAHEVRNDQRIRRAYDQITALRARYITSHPQSPLSIYYLSEMHRDSVLKMFPSLLTPSGTDMLATMLYGSLASRYNHDQKVQREIEMVSVGRPFVDFNSTVRPAGKPFNLAKAIKGKKAVLYFWGTWCDNGDIDKMVRLSEQHPDIAIIAVNYGDDDASIKEALTKKGVAAKWTAVAGGNDGKAIASTYKADGYPYAVAIDSNGNIAKRSLNITDEFINFVKSMK